MKNLWLFGILIGLAVFTYYFDELEGVRQRFEEKKKTQLFDLSKIGHLKGIRTSSAELFKIRSQYYTGKHHRLVNQQKIERFLEILSALRVSRVMNPNEIHQGQEGDYFPKENHIFEFIFSEGKIKYRLGKKLEFAQSFYVEIEKDGKSKIVVAYDSSPDTGVYRKEYFHRSDRKYLRLVNMSQLKEDFFYDLYIIKGRRGDTSQQFWERAKVKSKRNRAYELNFVDEQVMPSCPKGITYDSIAFSSFSNELLNLKAKQLYYPYRKEILKEWVGSLRLRDYDGSRYRLDLFRKYGSLEGYFLRATLNENLYELDFNVAQVFFVPAQDFCNLRAPFYEITKAKKEVFFSMKFAKHKESFKLYIPWQEKFEVSFVKEGAIKPNNQAFHGLFTFFSRKAEMVTQGSDKLIKEALFSLDYQGDTFYILRRAKELQLFSGKYNYLLHYFITSEIPIGTTLDDYFIKERNDK